MERASPLLVLLAALIPYLNALGGGFVSDAGPMIRDNGPLLASHEWLAWFGRDYYWGSAFQDVTLYRPLSVLSFLAHLRTTGLDPFPFLAGNVALHGAVSVLVLLLGRRLVGEIGALAGALLFATHPVHTESVAWVMGRAELLAAFFALGACLLFLHATAPAQRRPLPFAAASVISFFAALCSKEHVALLPVWLGLVPIFDRRRAGRPAILALAGSLLAVGVFLLLRANALTRTPEMILDRGLFNPAAVVSWPQRWLTAAGVIARHAKLMVWPRHLSHDYSYAQIPASTGLGWIEIAGIVMLLGVVVGIVVARSSPGVALCLSMAPITFLLVSNLPFAIGTVMAERLVYLPSAGIALAAGWLVGRQGRLAFAAILAVLALLAWRTWSQNSVWKDDYTLYTAALASSPRSAQVRIILAEHEVARGNLGRAVELAREALRIYPGSYSGHVALAKGLVARGEFVPAALEIRKALPLAPRDDRIRAQLHNNLCVVLAKQGQAREAVAECREAIRLAPDDLAPRLGLIELLRAGSRTAEARVELHEAMAVRPSRPALLYPLATAAYALGERESAAALARKAAQAGVAVPAEFYRALEVPP